VHNLGRDAALDRMREGLLRFLDHHQVDPKKYSEETTRFWIERIDQQMRELGDVSIVEKCKSVLAADFADLCKSDFHGSVKSVAYKLPSVH